MKQTLNILLCIIFSAVSFTSKAQSDDNPFDGYDEEVFMEWTFEKNIATPVVEKSEKKAISRYMKQLGEQLTMKKYNVEMMRQGEVMIVSLPTDEVFAPNDTLISARGNELLTPLLNLMKEPYMLKIVYTVNTDNTGTEEYLEWLSDSRNASLYDWFIDMIDQGKMSEDIVLIPYSMGASMPLAENDSRAGRLRNRRVEIFFIPGPEMIQKAKQKKL